MVSAELRQKFDNLTEKDFMDIAQSAIEAVIQERVKKTVLVYLSNPEIMIYDPINISSEYKFLELTFNDNKDILICIGLED